MTLLSLVYLGGNPAYAQNFSYHSDSPFGIQVFRPDTSRAAQTITFYDYDGDGDLDLLITGLDYLDDVPGLLQWKNIHFFIEWQENIGDAQHPQFAEREDIFPGFPYPEGYFFPTVGDLDDDNDPDFIASAEIDWIGNQSLLMFSNTGIHGKDQFEVTTMNNLPSFVPESLYKPHLLDLDQDGDLDLIASGFDSAFGEEDGANIPAIIYARNIGTKSTPDFEGWHGNPYEVVASPYGELLTSGDIDNDGDIDLVGSLINIPPDSNSYLSVHLNTPVVNNKPFFGPALNSPFGMPTAFGEVQFTFPTLADMDGDGDLDLFVFRNDANGAALEYYENALCVVEMEQTFVTICDGDVIDVEGQLISEEGTYEFDMEGPNGCALISILHVTVEDTYVIEVQESICDGETLEIEGHLFTEAGHYDVPLSSVFGCDSLISLELNVIVVDNSLSIAQNLLTANQSGAIYQWMDCDSGDNISGATGQSYEVTETGNYAVIITDGSGCENISECVNVVITGIEEELYANAITIYPNPAHEVLYMSNTSAEPVSSVTLTDVSGKVCGEFTLSNHRVIDVSRLEPGMYIARMQIKGLEVVKKLILM